MSVRVRIAPSPTGPLHVGTARTALFNFLFARQRGGKFIVRIEDTDRERSLSVYEDSIREGLEWLGLHSDENPWEGGPFGPYRQSERSDIYSKYVNALLESGNAYYCFCTKEEIEAERQLALQQSKAYTYSGKCRLIDPETARRRALSGEPAAIRLKVTGEKILINDLVRGEVAFDTSLFGDFVIVRQDKTPIFLLTNAIDDHEMGITHVIRGEDHLSNTPRQILIYKALNWDPPSYAHLPLLVNKDRSKISKRKNQVDLLGFRDQGYLPEAMVNFLALLGWSPGDEREIFSLQELIEEFNIEAVSKTSAYFDLDKLDYLNGYYMRAQSDQQLAQTLSNVIPELDLEVITKAVPLIKERIKHLTEARNMLEFLWNPNPCTSVSQLKLGSHTANEASSVLRIIAQELNSVDNPEQARNFIAEIGKAYGWDHKELFMLIRTAITGKSVTPPLFESMALLGLEQVKTRLLAAAALLQEHVQTA